MMTSIKKNKNNLLIFFILMIVTGFILYFMYMRVENFTDPNTSRPNTSSPNTSSPNTSSPNTSNPNTSNPNTSNPNTSRPNTSRPNTSRPNTIPSIICPNPQPPATPISIISRYFGVGFNVDLVNNNNGIPNYVIENIPITSTGTLGGVFAISSDGLLTIKLRNEQDPTQWWNIIKVEDSTATIPYYCIQPNSNSSFALQYENGNLAIRLYNVPGFEGQKWLTSQNKVTRSIPILNYSPGSLFTAEFDPYSTSNSISNNNLNNQNSQQVTDVVNAVKSGIQQYLSQMNNSQHSGQISASSLGNKSMPLNVNLNLRETVVSGKSGFANVNGSTTNEDVISLLDRYNSNQTSSNNTKNLLNQLSFNNQCNSSSNSLFNINDYTSNRVASCNAKL